MRIIGIDPGSLFMGFALIETKNSKKTVDSSLCLKISGVWKISSKIPFYRRLAFLSEQLESFVKTYNPDVLVLEKSFCGINIQTALKIGAVRGVVLSIAGHHDLDLVEYSPTSVKTALTSYGRCTKKDIQLMIRFTFPSKKTFQTSDESDAIAIALSYHYRENKNLYQRSCTAT